MAAAISRPGYSACNATPAVSNVSWLEPKNAIFVPVRAAISTSGRSVSEPGTKIRVALQLDNMVKIQRRQRKALPFGQTSLDIHQ